jgi:nucleoside phosphorylase
LSKIKADVLIIVATEVEARAVKKGFEQINAHPTEMTIDDRVYHDLGIVSESRIFLALSEMGSSGVGGALQTTSKAIKSLNPNAVFMVGIAFGINNAKQTIGDVLVSEQLCLYDLQRQGKDIHLRGDKPHASARLINYCRNTAIMHWPESGAKIQFGLLLTGDKLVDNVDYRDQLLELEPESIGGEMEGGGLYVACHESKVDWIVIKAICDWADGNKSKDYQLIAASNAVNFVIEVLRHASFKVSPEDPFKRELTENEKMLVLRLYDFKGTCIIARAKGEDEYLRVPGYGMDMYWGWLNQNDPKSEDARLEWIYVVEDLLQIGILEKTKRPKEYKLTEFGLREAHKLSVSRNMNR